VYDLIRPNDVRRRNTCASSADIEGLGELNKFGARGVGAADEDGHLQAKAGRASGHRGSHALSFCKNLRLHKVSLGTKELVRT
jgi:hypothetical protein